MIDKKRIIVDAIVQIMISNMIVVTTIVTYLPRSEYMNQLTWISNTAAAVIFLVGGIRSLRGKARIKKFIYRGLAITMIFVMAICILCLTSMHSVNFSGTFNFLHVVNPVTVLVYYLLFIDESMSSRIVDILITPCPVIAYLAYDYVSGKLKGNFVYRYLEVNKVSIGMALLIASCVYIALVGLAYLIYEINIRLGRRKPSFEIDTMDLE